MLRYILLLSIVLTALCKYRVNFRSHLLIYWVVLTMSSIFSILRTVSEARVIELVETNNGWITFSSNMLVMAPFRTLIPAVISPLACRLRSSVTVAIGFKPAFSANVDGITYQLTNYKNLSNFVQLLLSTIVYIFHNVYSLIFTQRYKTILEDT